MEPWAIEFLQAALAVLLPILIVGVVVVGALFFKDAKAWLKSRVSEKQWLLIESIISAGVRAAEQTSDLLSGPAKKAFVVSMCTRLFKRYNIPLEPTLLLELIEAVLAREKMLFGLDYVSNSKKAKLLGQGLPVTSPFPAPATGSPPPYVN
jgi:hypothetical protein